MADLAPRRREDLLERHRRLFPNASYLVDGRIFALKPTHDDHECDPDCPGMSDRYRWNPSLGVWKP